LKKLRSRLAVFFLLSLGVTCVPTLATSEDLSVLSLDELLDIDVISVAKVPEKIANTPAAIFILSQEDIRRSGVNTIPDALRMVPGMHVYQIDANKWAISSRGSASRFANKMLVMIDGRTVYSPLFSGVFWDSQDLMLEDIERIEVIRGPGGTLWGANAVNGIINIMSKDAADSQGVLVKAEVGTSEQRIVSARYGGWLSDRAAYRIYGKVASRGEYSAISGRDADDEWKQGRIGFRTDINLAGANKLTLQGDLYDGESGQTIQYLSPFPPFQNQDSMEAPISGGNLLARWTRTFSNDSEMIFQAYYDWTERQEFLLDETLNTIDLDFQQRYTFKSDLALLWGIGYRFNSDDTSGRETIPGVYSYDLSPNMREDHLYSGFLQGRVPFGGDRGEFTLGTKLEHNDYTGFEWQPSTRAMWKFNKTHSMWGAVSRSVRTPSRIEHDANVNAGAFRLPPSQGGLVTYVQLRGNEETDAERVWSYELGYRVRPTESFFVDSTIFYNKYDDLINGIPQGRPFVTGTPLTRYMVWPIQVDNGMDGETFGFEVSAQWSVKEWWRLTAGYTWFHFNELNTGISREARQGFSEGENANHRVSLVSYMDLPGNFELNGALYYVNNLPKLGFNNDRHIGSRVRLDINLGYHPTENLTISIGGRNLFEDDSREFVETMDGIIASEIPTIFYATVSYNY
jgi:iron complex outermembrane recepter protein